MWRKPLVMIAAATLITAPLSLALAQAQPVAAQPKTIEVQGHGEATAMPDTMIVSFSVESHAAAADECTRLQSEKTRKVVDALKAELPADAKVETADYSLNPVFGYASPAATPGAEPASRWDFRIDVTAYSPTIDNLGALIDAGMAAGATDIAGSGYQYLQDDEDSGAGSRATGGAVGRYLGRKPPKRMPAVSLHIEAQGSSAEEAVSRGRQIADKVEQAMREKLHGQGKVEVLQFGITRVNYARPMVYQPPPPPRPRKQSYDARVTVTATTHSLDKLGALIEAGMKSGAERLNQVSFTLRKDSDARKRAIEKASADAKSKAATLAGSMGVTLKGVLRISTNAVAHPQIVYGTALESFATGTLRAESMPVSPREVGFSADVNVVYQIE